jgi:hypothetical protein
MNKLIFIVFLASIYLLAFDCFSLSLAVDVHAQNQATISVVQATALPLVNTEGNQVKVVLNYSMGNDSFLGQRINAVMGIYDRINGTLIKLTSFPDGVVINNTVGTIQLASTLTDPKMQNISALVTLTNADKTEKYSNEVRSDLDMKAILPTSLAALNETLPPPASPSSSSSIAETSDSDDNTNSNSNSDDE